MNRATTALWGFATVCLIASGCASPYTYYCDDGCTPPTISGRVGDVPDWAPGQCGDCDTCDGCADCGSCGATDGCGCPPILGSLHRMLTCNSSCGEIYWGEWISDPPDECDPCDNCGNWVGPKPCCPPRGLTKLWYGLMGDRHGGCSHGSGMSCGCDQVAHGPSCGCDGSGHGAAEVWDGQELDGFDAVLDAPSVTADRMPSPEATRPVPSRSARHSRNPNSRLKRRTTL